MGKIQRWIVPIVKPWMLTFEYKVNLSLSYLHREKWWATYHRLITFKCWQNDALSGSSVKLHNCMYYTKYINTKNQRSFREGQINRPLKSRLVLYMHWSGKDQTTCIVITELCTCFSKLTFFLICNSNSR